MEHRVCEENDDGWDRLIECCSNNATVNAKRGGDQNAGCEVALTGEHDRAIMAPHDGAEHLAADEP